MKSIYRHSSCWLSGVALLFLGLSTAVAQETGLTPEMVVSLKQVRQVAIDPSGEKVAYVLSVPREADEHYGRRYSEIWVTSLSGGEAIQYTSKPTSSSRVSWSPDGTFLTFLSKRKAVDEHTQIYKLRRDGGEAALVTHHPASISSYRWSPDGKHIAFVAVDAKTEAEKKAADAGEDWEVADQNYKQHRLWIFDVTSGESRQLFERDLSVWSHVWTPDSKALIFQATETPLVDDSYMFKQIYRVSAAGGTPEVVCETPGKLGDMSISPDGVRLAFLGAVSQNDPLAQSLFVVQVAGGTPRNLSNEATFSATSVSWTKDKALLLLGVEGTHTTLRQIDAATGKGRTLVGTGPILRALELHAASGRFAAVGSTPQQPGEAFAGSLKNGKLTRLTDSNPQLSQQKLAKQEVIEWKGADDWRIEGILTYPLNYQAGQRYPLVLQVHGGPEGVSLNGWTTGGNYPVQVLAAHGYMVLQPNYRGSGGRGVAFSKADHDDLGGKEFEDILTGIDALIERGLVDGSRVGTGGWSYGGYMSAWAATAHSERFKASVVAAGLTNWISFAGTTDIPQEMALVHWNSFWYDQRDLHWQRSPVFHLENASTPTLIVHGKSDTRVHPEQSIQLYTDLKLKKVPTQLVLYPRQPHGLVERAHQIDFMKRVLAWFDKYLQSPGTF